MDSNARIKKLYRAREDLLLARADFEALLVTARTSDEKCRATEQLQETIYDLVRVERQLLNAIFYTKPRRQFWKKFFRK